MMNDRPSIKSDQIKRINIDWDTMKFSFGCTSSGNGRRFAYIYRDQLKYCYQHKAWYVWDHKYNQWQKAPSDLIQHAVDDLAAHIWQEVDRTNDDEARRLRLIRWALISDDPTWRRTTLEAAAGEPSLAIEPYEINPPIQKGDENDDKWRNTKKLAI